MNTEYISLNTFFEEIDSKSVTIALEYNTGFSGCICNFNSLDICVEDILIIFRDKPQQHTNTIKVDFQSILIIQKIKDGFKIVTDNCEIGITLN